MKILFTSNIPSPYRIDFFNELGKYCDLTVTFEGKQARNRDLNWGNRRMARFRGIILQGIPVNEEQFLCPGIIKVLRGNWDYIFMGGYSSPTAMLAIEWLKHHKKKFALEIDGGIIGHDSKIKKYLKTKYISAATCFFSSGNASSKYLVHYGARDNKIIKYPFTSLKSDDILAKCTNVIEKTRLRNELNINENKLIISVGQFIYRKGFDLLIKAAGNLDNNIGVYIIGGEPSEEYIKLKEKYKATNIHFVGFKSKKELSKYYKAADLFVLPTREDIWGLVINEAMAYGLPIITTDQCVAGLELVDAGNGEIIKAGSEKELEKAIKDLLSDDIKLNLMSRRSIEKIQGYTIEDMARVHMEFLEGREISE